MPRSARPLLAGLCTHIVSRGNARGTVFHEPDDYERFEELIASAQERVPLELFAWCLMPNHIHLVVRPRGDGDLSRWLHWLLSAHVQLHRAAYGTTGHIWQGRYRSFPIQADAHLLRVLRYVERNPVRAGLVSSAREWLWSSARFRSGTSPAGGVLSESPVALPEPWIAWVDEPLTHDEMLAIRTSVQTGRPLGDGAWTQGVTQRLGLDSTLRSRGRPRNL